MPKALGDHDAFKRWSGKPREWGPDRAGWRSWFGGGVVDGLCDLIQEHLDERRGWGMAPAAIGCVYWLTSKPVVDLLLQLNSCCVVVDKGTSTYALQQLNAQSGFPNAAISRLDEMMPAAADGKAPLIIGPYTPREATWHEIDAVRKAGWREGRYKPIAHAKLLVLGEIGWLEYDTPYGTQERFEFVPQTLWMGSANWTQASSSHLEVGFACNDAKLVSDAADFVADMIAFSEPITSTSPGPEPDLVEIG